MLAFFEARRRENEWMADKRKQNVEKNTCGKGPLEPIANQKQQ